MARTKKAILPYRGNPNPDDKGTRIKQKMHCYFCNNECTSDQHKIKQSSKIRIICGVCSRGTEL